MSNLHQTHSLSVRYVLHLRASWKSLKSSFEFLQKIQRFLVNLCTVKKQHYTSVECKRQRWTHVNHWPVYLLQWAQGNRALSEATWPHARRLSASCTSFRASVGSCCRNLGRLKPEMTVRAHASSLQYDRDVRVHTIPSSAFKKNSRAWQTREKKVMNSFESFFKPAEANVQRHSPTDITQDNIELEVCKFLDLFIGGSRGWCKNHSCNFTLIPGQFCKRKTPARDEDDHILLQMSSKTTSAMCCFLGYMNVQEGMQFCWDPCLGMFIAEQKLTSNPEYEWTLHLLDWVQLLSVNIKMFQSFIHCWSEGNVFNVVTFRWSLMM